jgi:hypothetical protein
MSKKLIVSALKSLMTKVVQPPKPITTLVVREPNKPVSRPRPKPRKRRVLGQVNVGQRERMTRSQAPMTLGFTLTNKSGFHQMSFGQAQKLADYNVGSSLRVTGQCYGDSFGVTGSGAGWGTAIGSTHFYHPLSPGWLSVLTGSRIETIESLFAWYCIRLYRIKYIGAQPTSTGGIGAMGVFNDYDDAVTWAGTGPSSPAGLLECAPNAMWSAWQTVENLLQYTNTGVKLFQTWNGSSETTDTKYQGAIGCMSLGDAGANSGYFLVEYVVDFYGDTLTVSTVDLQKRRSESLIDSVIINPTLSTK